MLKLIKCEFLKLKRKKFIPLIILAAFLFPIPLTYLMTTPSMMERYTDQADAFDGLFLSLIHIYEDNALGKLPDTRYKALDAQYAKEQDTLEIEIAELEKAVTGYEQSQKSAEKFIALIDKMCIRDRHTITKS